MRPRVFIPMLFRRLLWTAGGIAFLGMSSPTVFRGLLANTGGSIESFYSTDDFLKGATGVSHPSQKIVRILTALPPEKPILILVRERDDISSFLGLTLAYLAWPREVQMLSVSDKTASELLANIKPGSIGAIIFCKVQRPSWIPVGASLGRYANLVRLPSQVNVE